MRVRSTVPLIAALVIAVAAGACAKKVPPIARPTPPAVASTGGGPAKPPAPPQPITEPVPVPPEPVPEDTVGSKSLDDLNRDSPLKPVFFELDSADLGSAAQSVLQSNAGVLKQYASWQITIEGHCDERGSAEYNLALGERRASAARDYLVSLGIGAARVRTVSYGKEFPFDPAHDESGWSKNRRAHFVITAK
jgi:peptidoglycan-associated lipoprotein